MYTHTQSERESERQRGQSRRKEPEGTEVGGCCWNWKSNNVTKLEIRLAEKRKWNECVGGSVFVCVCSQHNETDAASAAAAVATACVHVLCANRRALITGWAHSSNSAEVWSGTCFSLWREIKMNVHQGKWIQWLVFSFTLCLYGVFRHNLKVIYEVARVQVFHFDA